MRDNEQDRMDHVVQYIKENSHKKLNLELLAGVSHLSKYHFSRIFTAKIGMTPVAFVNRERLHKATQLLAEGSHKTILEISIQCGFESVSTFNALFKRHYGQTPSEVRSRARKNSNYSAIFSNKQAELPPVERYNNHSTGNQLLKRVWDNMITTRELPGYEVAYVRHVGSYLDTRDAWDKLGQWASEQGLAPGQHSFIGISLDDSIFIDEMACRYDACVSLPSGFQQHGHALHIQFQTLSGGLYAVYPYYDTVEKFVLAYQNVFNLWLPNSQYEVDDRPCLEFCLNDPAQDAEGKVKVKLYVPIKQATS
ncbi:AraC family transcriptional regulator [Paenibacillus sp. JW14]|uniref:AraC family transcriptional regulator n=2 Tax=Paenibacillus agri TaxID=2744309 RepID=A0A850ENC5_9BACL|nr:AraC family transcriptional regulator [Paenibacillus agri]